MGPLRAGALALALLAAPAAPAAQVAPAAAQPGPDSVRVDVLQVRSDGRRFFPVEGTVTLPRGWRNVEFVYAVAGAPQGSFRYRTLLQGVDADWVERDDEGTAFYRDLPAGSHSFRVQAVGASWVREDAARIVVAPLPRETSWFWVMVGLLMTAGGLLLYVLRTARIVRRARALQAIVDERTRDLRDEQVRTEEALATAERERETARAALQTVEEQSRQLVRMDEIKNRFFANISHELRTPLTLVLSTLDDAGRGSLGALEPMAAERLRQASLNARRLLRLINELLDLAQLEAGGMELAPAPVDLAATAREVVRAFQPLAERQGVALSYAPSAESVPAHFDSAKLEHVLFNLLSNALKATPEHGKVLVALEAAPAGAGVHATLRVQDTGPGIAPDILPHVFDRYFRADTPGRLQGAGTGLGLALARELTELHGGTLRAESTVGFGSTFIIELDLAGAGADELQAPAGAPEEMLRFVADVAESEAALAARAAPPGDERAGTAPADAPARVLVVEDNAEVAELLAGYLSPHFRVEIADGAEAALAAADVRRPDLVLSDVAMDGMDGFELARRMRRRDELSDVPLVFLTARASEQSRLEGLGLGAEDYITKPFDGPELVARLANIVDSRRRLRARYGTQVFINNDPAPVKSADAVFLERAHAAVEERLADESMTVGDFARTLGVSEAQLKRRLRALAGESPVEFIRSRRLERAAALLAGRAGAVSEVAAAVGFGSPSYFARCFRERYGVAPSEYS